MKHNLLKSLIISVILLTGVSNAWGDTRQFLIGDATGGNWTENKFAYPVDSYYGQDNKCCIYVWMQTNQHFAFCNYTGTQYGPKINNSEPIYDGSAIHDNDNGRGAYEQYDQNGNVIKDSNGKNIPTTNAWKYTGNTGLVRICVDYSFEGNVWRPYVWVEELTEVMKGNEIMFYFGNTWGWENGSGKNEQYLRTANNTDPSNIQFVGKAGFEKLDSKQTYSTCCKVPTGNYYISNNSTWPGIPIGANAEAGAMYSLTNNGSDIINVIPGVKPTWNNPERTITIPLGTEESGIAATCGNSGNSVINKPNTIYYCYTQDNQNFHRFDPNDVSNLPLGTYTVWAIACDGHIAVRSAEPITLKVSYFVTLEGSSYGTFKVEHNNTTYTSESTDIRFPVNAGDQVTITDVQVTNENGFSNHYNKRMGIGITGSAYETFTVTQQGASHTINSNTTIAEDFITIEPHTLYIKVPIEGTGSAWNNNLKIVCFHGFNQANVNYPEVHAVSVGDPIFVTSNYKLYKYTIPAGNHTFHLYCDDKKQNNTWQFNRQIPIDEKNCWEITGDNAEGQWVDPRFTVTLKATTTGQFTIKHGHQTYTSDHNEDVTFRVPYGEEITIIESAHYTTSIYNGDLIWKEENGYWQELYSPKNRTLQVYNNIVIRENFVVSQNAVKDGNLLLFLKIPKDLDTNTREDGWQYLDKPEDAQNTKPGYQSDEYANFVWLGEQHSRELSHNILGSTIEERGCPGSGQSNGHFLMNRIIENDPNYNIYYCVITDSCWYNIKFERKHADSDVGHSPIVATTIQSGIQLDKTNCFTITHKQGNAFEGYWEEAPQCQVVMGYTNIGRYGIKDHTGEIHYATPGAPNTTFYVPYGSKVEVLEGEPGNNAYNGMVGIFNASNTKFKQKFHDGVNVDNFVKITQDTAFDDLFVSKQEHIVYLGVPNEGFEDWYIGNNERITAYIFVPRDYDYSGIPDRHLESEGSFIIDNTTYYKFTLPKGIYKFKFTSRTSTDGERCASREFPYQIPVTEYNCFILDGNKNGNAYYGYWAKLPAKPENVGDYRVLYAEKELIKTMEEGESENWETAFRTVYEHPSDIIPQNGKEDTVSLHINTSQKRNDKTVHPMVILQQFQQIENNTYKWANLQAHTVLPLKATGNMGMLPGRKKAFGDLPFYDDGIEAIKNDTTYSSRLDGLYKGSGVWNFTVTQGVSQSGTTVTLNVGNTTRYTGKYYIRTEALTNGWDDYTDNLMTYSDYADYNSGFSHYFCKWLLVGNNVKFTIANDYAQSISDPLYGDATDLWGEPIEQMVDNSQVLDEDANVRFAWYEMNNFVHRAYLGGSTHVHDRFLVVKGDDDKIFSHYVGEGLPAQGDPLPKGADFTPRYGLDEDEEIFRDDANWIYHADVQILPGCSATITAKHDGIEQYFIKDAPLVHGYDPAKAKNKYPIRLLYDFKINRLITGYIPNGNNSTDIEPFTTNLMLIRKHHEPATQLLFNSNAKTTQGAYGVMTFERDFLRDNTKTNKERAAYFISFPFDVKISDVFGFGQFYKHWFIQYYDGEARAKNGLWADTDTYWRHITDPNTVLEAHKGYALLFSLSNIEKSGVLDASKEICLYFPSTDNNIGNITDVNPETSVEVPAHVCTIERENRKVKDSNWNLIGVPAYADVSDFTNKTFKDPYNNEVYFYWKRDASTDEYDVCDAKDSPLLTFQTMHAYMLQYAGVINWKAHTMSQPSQLIARRNTEQEASHTLRITLNQADKKLDQTYVRLQEEDATADFEMNKDQYKIRKAKANIYSLIQNAVGQIEAGANVLPLQTTIVPLGVIIKTAGEYTFSMPDGTDGIIAELIDYQTNTRTNLLLDNYTVTLPAGTNNSRFALSLQPDKTVTSVDNIGNEATGDKVKKYLIDGVLYMQKDGVLYDAQGKLVR